MKPSLNEIAENIAFMLGDQFNMTFRQSIKHTIGLLREKLLREEDFNVGLNYNDFRQNISMPLEEWSHPICGSGKITKDVVPSSIRFKHRGRVNFYYVGDDTFGNPYTQTTLVEYPFIKKLKYNIEAKYYIVEDEKIIILDEHKLCKLGISGVFAQPQNLASFCENPETIIDDEPYPISGDLLSIIRQMLVTNTFPILQRGEKDVIASDSTNDNVQQIQKPQ